jgi:hypothetical protein
MATQGRDQPGSHILPTAAQVNALVVNQAERHRAQPIAADQHGENAPAQLGGIAQLPPHPFGLFRGW